MARRPTLWQMLLTVLAIWHDRSQKEIAAAAGLSPSRVSQLLRRQRDGEIKDEDFDRLLAAIDPSPVERQLVTACLEALEAVEACPDFTQEEMEDVVRAALEAARTMGEGIVEVARLSRIVPDPGYPEPHEVEPARRRAEEQWARLAPLAPEVRSALLKATTEFQNWALCERICAESERKASRKVEEAAELAHLAEEIAETVRGPEGWRDRIRGYAKAHGANALRVAGELKAAEAVFGEASRLWYTGSDSEELLDPGRLLDLEASLLRAQREFPRALELLDQAAVAGRCPDRVLIKKAFTLEAMGEYERAVETLLKAEPFVERQGDERLRYMRRFNLAVNYCHIGRYEESTALARTVREQAAERGDEIELSRVTWLEGRIAAGEGRPIEARRLLAQARQEFDSRGMSYDAALALLEEAALLLAEGRPGEVRVLAGELTKVFRSKRVHREALSALRLFHEAVLREEATAGLARRILRFLFRARYDHALQFKS